jgi:ankyrin repeat protein
MLWQIWDEFSLIQYITECLIEYGYNIDHSDTNLPTPLFSARKYGHKDIEDFLLKRIGKVNAIDKNG